MIRISVHYSSLIAIHLNCVNELQEICAAFQITQYLEELFSGGWLVQVLLWPLATDLVIYLGDWLYL